MINRTAEFRYGWVAAARAGVAIALMALLTVRLLISENYEPVEFGFLSALQATGGGLTPATSAWLDFWLLFFSAGALAGEPLLTRVRGAALLAWGALLIAVILSTACAANQRLAASGGANVLASALAAAALARVLRPAWLTRLLLAALLAALAVNGLKCLMQSAFEFRDTRAFLEERKPALAEQGVDLESPYFVNYERRLRSGETFGRLAHPNVTASVLLMGALVSAGMLLAAWRQALGPLALGGAAATLGLLATALPTTGSFGALLSAVPAMLLLLILERWSGWWAQRPARGAAWLLLAVGGGGAALGMIGLISGTLPHESLAFRWNYWVAGLSAWLPAWWCGIGRWNFLDAYLAQRPPISTEDVRDPHSLWLTLLIELGPLAFGAAIVLLWLTLRGALSSLRPVVHRVVTGPAAARPNAELRAHLAAMAVGALATLTLLLYLDRADLQEDGRWSPALLTLWSVEVAGAWLLVFAVCCRALLPLQDGRALAAGVCAALMAGLIHNTIDMALTTPAGLALLAGLSGGVLALRPDEPAESGAGAQGAVAGPAQPAGPLQPARAAATSSATAAPASATDVRSAAHILAAALRRGARRIATPARCALLFALPLTHYLVNTRPVALASAALARGEPELAAQLDRWDPVAPRRYAQVLLDRLLRTPVGAVERELPSRLEAAAFTAYRRQPTSAAHAALLAESYALLAKQALLDKDSARCQARWEEELRWRRAALRRDPQNPRRLIELAATCTRFDNAAIRQEGAAALRRAEAIDEQRPELDASRLRPLERERIRALRLVLEP